MGVLLQVAAVVVRKALAKIFHVVVVVDVVKQCLEERLHVEVGGRSAALPVRENQVGRNLCVVNILHAFGAFHLGEDPSFGVVFQLLVEYCVVDVGLKHCQFPCGQVDDGQGQELVPPNGSRGPA